MLEKESYSEKIHEIIGNMVELLCYFESADVVENVVSAIADMEGLAEVLLIKKGENTLLESILNVISNNDTAHAIVQRCAVNMNDPIALAQTANNVKDKEIVYYMMEVLKKNGMLMNKEMLCLLRHDIVSILIYGMPSASDNLRLVENHEVAKILSYFRNHDDAIDILIYVPEPAAEILKCMKKDNKDAIDNMVKDISLARRLNEIGADDIEELKRVFHYSERGMTVMQFKHLDHKVASVMIDRFFNGKKSFLIELSERMEESIPEFTQASTADQHHAQIIIDKVWNVYKDDSVSDLLLDMSDDERKLVLKQLGHKHEIDALIYVGRQKKYKNEEGRKEDVRRIFNAIEGKQRNGLLNDISYEGEFNRYRFNKLMKVLKGSVEYKEITDMLLGVKDKSRVARMIVWISTWHEDEYAVDILLSIDDNRLRSMISKLKEWLPEIIAKILSRANEVGKLTKLFNIIVSSDISEQNMEIVLANIEINDNIVNELINKPEDEQNEILCRINNIKLADKIKCATKEAEARRKRKRKKIENTNKALQVVQPAQQAQSIRKEHPNDFFDRYENDLYNIPEILNSSDYAKLEKNKADMQKMMDIIKLVINELADSGALKMNNTDGPHDVWTNESSGVVEKWEDIICIIETINRMILGNTGLMNEIMLNNMKIYGYSSKYLYELINMMNKMINDAEGLKGEECKEVYDQIAMICNDIKKKICMHLIEMIRMLNIVNLIFHEIDKTVVMKYNGRFKKLKLKIGV